MLPLSKQKSKGVNSAGADGGRIRRWLGLGPPVPMVDSVFCDSNDVPRQQVPEWMTDRESSSRLAAMFELIRWVYTRKARVLPNKWDERFEVVAQQNMAIQIEHFGPEFVETQTRARDLWMCDHWHFPFLFMISAYNAIGFWFLSSVDQYGLSKEYREYAMPFVILFSMITAWFLDFLWELIEQSVFIVTISYFPLSNFARGFGPETRTNSVVIDPATGFFGIFAATCTIVVTDYLPQFSMWSVEFWVQFILLLFILQSSGKDLWHLAIATACECVAIVLLYYVWFGAHWLFVLLWTVCLVAVAACVALGCGKFNHQFIREPLYSFISLVVPLHFLYAVVCFTFVIVLD